MIKISSIKANPDNPRVIKDAAFEKLCNSIKDFPKMMALRPMVVDADGVVLGGNMRLRALQHLGYKEIPDEWVKRADDLTPEEQKRFIITDNVPAGEWDWDELANGWDENDLTEWGIDLPTEWGATQEAVEDEYEIPEEIETDIVLGDIFEIGKHRLMCGDSTDSDTVAELMNNQMADMVFTDPPYDLKDSYSQHIFDLAKDECHIFIMNSDRLLIDNVNNGIKWFRKFFAVDFRLATLVSNNQPMTRVDLIAEFCKGKTKFNNLFDGFSTLIECSKIRNGKDKENFGHKQAKKIELPAKFIKHYSRKGEMIVDLFGGSGSTMAACEQLNRKCYMMEYDPKNCQIIIDRMKKCYTLDVVKI